MLGIALLLLASAGCETVYVDGVAKWRFRRTYQGVQTYPPRFAPYDEPVFNYDVRWDPKRAQVTVSLHPVKSIGTLRPQTSALAELSHDENAAPCANCDAQYAAGGKARLSRKFVFGIPENQPRQINQIYFFQVQYGDDAGAEQTEVLFFYDAEFYPVLVNYYASRKAKLKRLAGSKK